MSQCYNYWGTYSYKTIDIMVTPPFCKLQTINFGQSLIFWTEVVFTVQIDWWVILTLFTRIILLLLWRYSSNWVSETALSFKWQSVNSPRSIFSPISMRFGASNIILMNLFTNFAICVLLGHNRVAIFCCAVRDAKCLLIEDTLPNKQFLFVSNTLHPNMKWASSSMQGALLSIMLLLAQYLHVRSLMGVTGTVTVMVVPGTRDGRYLCP